jgi:two-component system, OmpR family, response regulator MtrA
MALKILSIDDEPSITLLISALLGTHGMEVITANSGREGLQLFRAETPDLVLLDVMMPGMNGLEVCQAIRSFSNVPIIGFSALSDPREIANAMKAGFNDFLEKPSSTEILVARIQDLTAGKA